MCEFLDLGWHRSGHAVLEEISHHCYRLVGVARAIEVAQALLRSVRDGDLAIGVAQLQQRREARGSFVVEVFYNRERHQAVLGHLTPTEYYATAEVA